MAAPDFLKIPLQETVTARPVHRRFRAESTNIRRESTDAVAPPTLATGHVGCITFTA